ncbi:phosphotransferase [candidate division WWE3 bacterium]|nr:phosphotransferase [candidate division WWE3 bacterium]
MEQREILKTLRQFQINPSQIKSITDLKTQQGWSSRYLYKIEIQENALLLKGKTRDQIKGYQKAIKTAKFLLTHEIPARKSHTTLKGTYQHKDSKGITWLLSTYIPGADFREIQATAQTYKTLAKYMRRYISLTLENPKIVNKLGLAEKRSRIGVRNDALTDNAFETLTKNAQKLKDHHKIFSNLIPQETKEFANFLKAFQKTSPKFQNLKKSLIHNDISNKNIVVDPKTKKVRAIIDWDHATYNFALKDLTYVMFLIREAPEEKQTDLKTAFLKPLQKELDLRYDLLDELYIIYKTNYVWDTIIFHADLIGMLGNSTNELEKFETIIKEEAQKWLETFGNN